MTTTRIAKYHSCLIPTLIKLLELPWHHQHEDIASTFQYLKLPQTIDALYKAALVEYDYYDEFRQIARVCTWALADIGTAQAYRKLELLAQCDEPMVVEYARKRIDNWEREKSRKARD